MSSSTSNTPASIRASAPHQQVGAREVLALNIIRLRKDLGWSQEELAIKADLHRTFIAHVERQVRNISLDNVEKIADALGVSVGLLLTI
ncbi:helix-turn-helix domain-containing protein [Limnohabitans sp. DM1]|uniref:helix-turn-helix domain-containing protein n=1 Tax=Limnohabitans sp. DM1 TaxID=1597955 RepID=UPI000B80135E|nr:helix-turn-helix transcriptional regulator [Limnohabitans sp. DM1]